MARPKKKSSERKKENPRFVIYVTDAERALCLEAARLDGMPTDPKTGGPTMGPWFLALGRRRAAALKAGGLPIGQLRDRREALIRAIEDLFHDAERDQRIEATAAADAVESEAGET